MKRRHREWILKYNANLDLLQPRTDAELRKEMEKWESLHGENKDARSTPAFVSSASHEATPESEKAAAAHKSKYHDHFNDMIEQMRKRRKVKTTTDINTEEDGICSKKDAVHDGMHPEDNILVEVRDGINVSPDTGILSTSIYENQLGT
jgi:glutaredoxin 2